MLDKWRRRWYYMQAVREDSKIMPKSMEIFGNLKIILDKWKMMRYHIKVA